jgi:hypothetical protein
MNAFLGQRPVASAKAVGSALQSLGRTFNHFLVYCVLGLDKLELELSRTGHQESPHVRRRRDLTLPGAWES